MKISEVLSVDVRYPEIPNGTGLTDRELSSQWKSTDWSIVSETVSNLQSQFAKQPNWLTPEKVETRQSGVKGNFYAPFVGEGKQATAFSYPTYLN